MWCAADTDLGFTRDRRSYARKSGKPGLHGPPRLLAVPDQRCTARYRSRCIASGTHDSVGCVRSLIHFSNSPSRSRGAFLRPGFATLLRHPESRGGAPRNVRALGEAPVRRIMCVKDARERAYDAIRQALARRLASHNAGRSPLGAPPWLRSLPLIPAPAFAGTNGKRLTPRLAPHSGSSLEHALNERGCESFYHSHST